MNPKVSALNPEIQPLNPRVYNPRQNVPRRIKPKKTKNPALQREQGFDKGIKINVLRTVVHDERL